MNDKLKFYRDIILIVIIALSTIILYSYLYIKQDYSLLKWRSATAEERIGIAGRFLKVWKNGPYNQRDEMVMHFFENIDSYEMSLEEIERFFGKPDHLRDIDTWIYILNYNDDSEQEPLAVKRYLWPLKLYVNFQDDNVGDVYREYRREIDERIPFDDKKWKSPNLDEREQMAEELISFMDKNELSEIDVLEILGEPDSGRGKKVVNYYFGKSVLSGGNLLFLIFSEDGFLIDFGIRVWD